MGPTVVLLVAIAYVLLSLAVVAGIGVWSYCVPCHGTARKARWFVFSIVFSQVAALAGAIGYAVCAIYGGGA